MEVYGLWSCTNGLSILKLYQEYDITLASNKENNRWIKQQVNANTKFDFLLNIDSPLNILYQFLATKLRSHSYC